MAFGIIRVRNVHMNEVRSTEIHNDRQFEENGLKRPEHIKTFDRESLIFHAHERTNGLTDKECIENRFSEAGIKPRKNSVVALEYVMTMSPEVMAELDKTYSMNALLTYFSEFISKKHDAKNIISISKHYDESNPHVHVLVVPIQEKEVKWKNKNGEGKRIENRLCARDYTGDKDKLRGLQTDYFKYLTEDFPINLKKDFKIELKRGVDARNKRARGEFYSKMTNHVLGEIREKLFNLEKQIKENKITLEEFKAKESDLKLKITAVSDNIERKKEKDSDIYQKNEIWSENTVKLNLDKKPWSKFEIDNI